MIFDLIKVLTFFFFPHFNLFSFFWIFFRSPYYDCYGIHGKWLFGYILKGKILVISAIIPLWGCLMMEITKERERVSETRVSPGSCCWRGGSGVHKEEPHTSLIPKHEVLVKNSFLQWLSDWRCNYHLCPTVTKMAAVAAVVTRLSLWNTSNQPTVTRLRFLWQWTIFPAPNCISLSTTTTAAATKKYLFL